MRKLMTIALALVAGVTATTAFASVADLHFALTRSAPEAEATVESPEAIQLWFSQVPQDGSVAIRLVDGAGELVEVGDPTPDAADGKHLSVAVDGALNPGAYTVAWRGIGDDGHVVRGEFPFSVATR